MPRKQRPDYRTRPIGRNITGTASDGSAGAMSASDKAILDGLRPGIYVPPTFGQFFVPALANAGTTPAVVALPGDSISMEMYAQDYAHSYMGLIQSRLQAAFGNGGSGLKMLYNSTKWMTSASVAAAAVTAYGAADSLWNFTGTWASYAGATGTSGTTRLMAAYSSTDNSTPAAASITGSGRYLDVNTVTNNGSNAAWKYQVNGGSFVNVADSAGGAGLHHTITTIDCGAPGTNTVNIVYNDSAKTLYFWAGTFRNTTGVRVDNAAVYGKTAAFFDNSVATGIDPAWVGGFKSPASLIIYPLGANDAVAGITGEAFIKSVSKTMDAVRDGTGISGANDVLFVFHHNGSNDQTNYIHHDYASRLRGMAADYDAALVDFNALGLDSWNYWHALGFWGNTTDVTTSGTDPIHPSSAGHLYIANQICSNVLNLAINTYNASHVGSLVSTI